MSWGGKYGCEGQGGGKARSESALLTEGTQIRSQTNNWMPCKLKLDKAKVQIHKLQK